jgi:hypothetical protein
MLMGATTYRLVSEIVATGEEPTFPRMAELPQIVFSKTLRLPPRWATPRSWPSRSRRPCPR